jgi:hypothetical protein
LPPETTPKTTPKHNQPPGFASRRIPIHISTRQTPNHNHIHTVKQQAQHTSEELEETRKAFSTAQSELKDYEEFVEETNNEIQRVIHNNKTLLKDQAQHYEDKILEQAYNSHSSASGPPVTTKTTCDATTQTTSSDTLSPPPTTTDNHNSTFFEFASRDHTKDNTQTQPTTRVRLTADSDSHFYSPDTKPQPHTHSKAAGTTHQ